MGAHACPGHPPLDPLLDQLDVARRGRYVVAVFGQPRHGAVVHDHAVVGTYDAIANAPHPKVREAVCVYLVQQRRGVSTLDIELSQRAHVDDADPLADRQALVLRRAVAVCPLPRRHVDYLSAELEMLLVQRSAFDRYMGRPCEGVQGDRLNGRSRGGRAYLVYAASRPFGCNTAERLRAHLALARAHGYGAVTLERLDVLEPFVDTLRDVGCRHVLAKAYEPLRSLFAPHGRGLERLVGPVRLLGGRGLPLDDLDASGACLSKSRRGLGARKPPLEHGCSNVMDACHVAGRQDSGGQAVRDHLAH